MLYPLSRRTVPSRQLRPEERHDLISLPRPHRTDRARTAGTATAALLDLGGSLRRGRSAGLAVAANMGGLASGTFVAGLLAGLAPNPLRTPYWLLLALVVLTARS